MYVIVKKEEECKCGEYLGDILNHLHEKEVEGYHESYAWRKHEQSAPSDFIGKARVTMTFWIHFYGNAFKLSTSTISLAINVIDRLLSKWFVRNGENYQLLAIVALVATGKYKEMDGHRTKVTKNKSFL